MTTLHSSSHNARLPRPDEYSRAIDAHIERTIADNLKRNGPLIQPDPEKLDGSTKLVALGVLFFALFITALFALGLNRMR